ncbi:MAG: ethanolamine ammonia-lyase reactivating factor EutA [Synergistaceae bacterium]|jgi:ethanolamine utilization protein EutA|nr:ethanolamine ammonia-lyase reactivating factor EutA [Synergistaceae bacterium]
MREAIMSVGIDIGTSTTQLVFSRIEIENLAGAASVPRVQIVSKQVVYRSDIYFTPLFSSETIDGERIREIVTAEYAKAGIKPEDLSAGAVIITGETARKENARVVLDKLSGYAGNFVVATAGSDLEGIIAGRGAGTAAISKDEGKLMANFDVGGGTTNVAVFSNGEVAGTSCLDIGGRLVRISPDSRHVEYMTPKIKELAASMNLGIREGRIASLDALSALAARMASFIDELTGFAPESDMLDLFITSRRFRERFKLDGVTFSGGVADAVYAQGPADGASRLFRYGDMGIMLGQAIRGTEIFKKVPVREPAETIRATVVGAGIHIVNVSGSTISYTGDVFPLKNIPVLKVSPHDEADSFANLGDGIAEKLRWFREDGGYQQVAIGMSGARSPSFDLVGEIASQIARGAREALAGWKLLIVIVEEDMAKALGHALSHRLGDMDVVSIDSIRVENGDYVDIGSPLGQGRVVPVVVKTLVFGG